VSANSGLRQGILDLGTKMNANVYLPPFQYCTDNAGMIAITAHYKYLAKDFLPLASSVTARSDW
jgi:N6-L-threonylcarbamoyladenine synthase